MTAPNTDSYFHLAKFAVSTGELFVPLSAIASIIYSEDDDQWIVVTTNGNEYEIDDPQGGGIHTLTQDLVTWQIRQNPSDNNASKDALLAAFRQMMKDQAAAEGSMAS